MNRKSSVDTGNPWLILTAAHDYLWRTKFGNFRDRFEATGLLWKLAIETGLAQHKEKAYVETLKARSFPSSKSGPIRFAARR